MIKALTNCEELINVTNRLGHGVSYSILEEMETENAYKVLSEMKEDCVLPPECKEGIFTFYILHVDTNYLCLDRPPELIARSIIDLALTLKSESHDINVSNIVVRNDSDTLNKKRCEVNAVLMECCKEKNIYLIDS